MSNQQFQDFEKSFLAGQINAYMYARISIAGTERSETKEGRVIDVSLTDPTAFHGWDTSFKFTTDNPEIKYFSFISHLPSRTYFSIKDESGNKVSIKGKTVNLKLLSELIKLTYLNFEDCKQAITVIDGHEETGNITNIKYDLENFIFKTDNKKMAKITMSTFNATRKNPDPEPFVISGTNGTFNMFFAGIKFIQ